MPERLRATKGDIRDFDLLFSSRFGSAAYQRWDNDDEHETDDNDALGLIPFTPMFPAEERSPGARGSVATMPLGSRSGAVLAPRSGAVPGREVPRPLLWSLHPLCLQGHRPRLSTHPRIAISIR